MENKKKTKEEKNVSNFKIPSESPLAASSAGQGSCSQYRVSTLVKYSTRHRGHRSAALKRPMSEKKRDTWP
jgi:hypothetical protein